jgi:hypothetical protein
MVRISLNARLPTLEKNGTIGIWLFRVASERHCAPNVGAQRPARAKQGYKPRSAEA